MEIVGQVLLNTLVAEGLEYAGSKAKQYMKGGSKNKKKRSRSAPPGAPGSQVAIGGTTSGRGAFRKKRKKRRKKKSTKALLRQLKRNIPKKSYKTHRDFRCLRMQAATPNLHKVYELHLINPGLVENVISGLTASDTSGTVDYTAENTSVKISTFYKLMCKNNATGNVKIRYALYKCTDDDGESILTNILEGLGDRGYTGLPSVTASSAATATASYQPQQLIFGATTPFHVPIFGIYETKRKWKQLGKVQSATIGPGDSFDIVKAIKFVYKPEVNDNEPFTYQKNYTYHLIVDLMGEISHDQTNDQLIGRSGYQLDCEEQRNITACYSNPKGLNEIEYSDTLTDTNFTTPVHADNFASAIEIVDI